MLNAIIPLGYVEGSIFSHDEALRAPAVPMLRLIDDLPSLPAHDRNAALVKLRRAANRLKIAGCPMTSGPLQCARHGRFL